MGGLQVQCKPRVLQGGAMCEAGCEQLEDVSLNSTRRCCELQPGVPVQPFLSQCLVFQWLFRHV